MVSDKWTFDCLIGYNGKVKLWPIKSRNEDAVSNLIFICLVVLTKGVIWDL